MTWSKARNAYLRRHGQLRPSHAADDLEVPHGATPPAVKVTTRPTSGSSEKSFGQRRKEMLLLRAGRRPVREVEVTVGAVAFAAKLRRQASAGSDPGNDGRSRAITAPTADDLEIIAHHRNGASLEEDPTLIRQRSASAPTVPSPMPAPKEFQQKSSLQKRKENLLARARGGRPRETEVALTAIAFAAKLKSRSSRNLLEKAAAAAAEGAPNGGAAEAPAAAPAEAYPVEAPAAAEEETPRAAKKSHHEKSFAQKRKEMYLKRKEGKPAPTEVAVTAVAFAARLKSRSSTRSAAKAHEKAVWPVPPSPTGV